MVIIDLMNKIPDPRMYEKVKHPLATIIFSALCGVLSGCESWEDIHLYAKEKKEWLSQFVLFSNSIPSEWTYRRLFTLLSCEKMEIFLRTFARYILEKSEVPLNHVAVDGKRLRGSTDKNGFSLHSVTAFCHEHGLVLGEESVSEKSNEIKAIPLLIDQLDLKGTTVSMDAGGCHKQIATQIREKKGSYVLCLKRNHPQFFDTVLELVKDVGGNDTNRLHDAIERRNGRTVRRRYFGYDISQLPVVKDWKDLKTVVAVESITSKDNDPSQKVTAAWRYYITNHHHLDRTLPGYIRNHWGIENKLHWVLDVQMREDDDKKIEKKSVRSFALLKRTAINIVNTKKIALQKTATKKKKPSTRSMMKRAG